MLAAARTCSAQAVNAAQLDSIIRRAVADKHLVGLSVGVMQDGKIVLAKGYGVKTLGTTDSVTPRTMFAIGSVTKQFTCSALMILAEEKKLSLTDPVAKYFPKLTRAKDITLLDLGGHLSGYRDYYPLDFVDNEMQKPATADAIIDEYATRPLDFEPRSRYSYSNTGFLILGRVIEKASGQPFGEFITKRLFTPLVADAHGVRAGVERDQRHGEGLLVVRPRAADSGGARGEGLGGCGRRDLVDANRSAQLGSCARRAQADLGGARTPR